MAKYRIRLKDKRVIGPLELSDINELFIKKTLDGSESVQIYPTGDWKNFESFDELKEINTKLSDYEPTYLVNLDELEDTEKSPVEFDDQVEKVPDSYPKKFDYRNNSQVSENTSLEEDTIEEKDIADDEKVDKDISKTDVVDFEEQPDLNKTIVTSDTKDYLKKLKEQKLEEERLLEEESTLEPEVSVDLDHDSTQFISLDQARSELVQASEQESDHRKEVKQVEKEKKKLELAKIKREQAEQKELEDEDDEEDSSNVIKKLIPVVAICLIIFFIWDGLNSKKDKQQLKPVTIKSPVIDFPIKFDSADKEKAEVYYSKGIDELNTFSYTSIRRAAIYFRKSVENHDVGNSKALFMLMFTYSYLLNESNKFSDDANTLFKLIQINSNKILSDATITASVALFYYRLEKYSAAISTVEKFNDVKSNKPTPELFAVYLDSLISSGDLIKSSAVAKKLSQLENKSHFVATSLMRYFILNERYEDAVNVLQSVEKKYVNNVELLLYKAQFLLYNEDFSELSSLLTKVRELGVDNSKLFYSKFLEYKALVEVSEGNIPRAVKYFKKALKTNESLELRSRLASLSDADSADANVIIQESKAIQLISSSKNYLQKYNWRFATKDALEATRVAPDYIPAKLHLADIQISQGIYGEALKNLQSLYNDNPTNNNILFELLNAYVDSYKFSQFKDLFNRVTRRDVISDSRYFSVVAKFYYFKDEYSNAAAWLIRAINKNPLNEQNLFLLAKLYLKYKKFNKAKVYLRRAMELDPVNVSFRIVYSEIIYETDGVDYAIGYLYDILKDFKDNPKILSQIGIYYYKSGQQKSFEEIKEKISKLPQKDISLFQFMIDSALIDDRLDDVISYAKKLILIEPGNLAVRLKLAQIFMNQEKYKEALLEFKAIESRLDTYPKLQYYMSKLFLLTDNTDKAMKLAQKEIDANSTSEDGYILLGDIYRRQKDYLNAEKLYKKAQKINGDNVDMLIGLSIILFKKSQYEIALDLLLKARKVEPSKPEIHKLLGDAYRKTSQSALAIESYRLFLELSPNTKYKNEINTYINTMK